MYIFLNVSNSAHANSFFGVSWFVHSDWLD